MLRVKYSCLLVMSTKELRMLRISAVSVWTWDGRPAVVLSRANSGCGGAGAPAHGGGGGRGPCLPVSGAVVASEPTLETLGLTHTLGFERSVSVGFKHWGFVPMILFGAATCWSDRVEVLEIGIGGPCLVGSGEVVISDPDLGALERSNTLGFDCPPQLWMEPESLLPRLSSGPG